MRQRGRERRSKGFLKRPFVTAIVSLFVDLDKPPKEEEAQSYAFVSIDSSHKVSDHYVSQEKLGV